MLALATEAKQQQNQYEQKKAALQSKLAEEILKNQNLRRENARLQEHVKSATKTDVKLHFNAEKRT